MNLDSFSDISNNTKLDKKLDLNSESTVYIQLAIETLVKHIVDTLDSVLLNSIESLCNEFSSQNPNYQRTDVHGEKILKVGSFYEDTKIIFPDEFDFIYILSAFNIKGPVEDSKWKKHYFTLNKLHDDIQRVLYEQFSNRKLEHRSNQHCVKFNYYMKKQGPASKLLFTYVNKYDDTDSTSISVDIVPAFKIFDEHLESKIKCVCNIDEFADEVLRVNAYLITNEISFTETELHCMKYILSDGHRCVYRVLKYMINGDGDGEELRKNIPSAGISTYMVKVATIKHHFSCSGYCKESECLLQILDYLLLYVSRNFDDNILCKLNGSPFDIAQEDCLTICTWLQNKIQKYKNRFSDDTAHLLLKAPRDSDSNTFYYDINKIPYTDFSDAYSVALSGFIQSNRESRASSIGSLHGHNLVDYNNDTLNDLDVFKEQEEQRLKEHVEYEDGAIFDLFDYNNDTLNDLDVFEEQEEQRLKEHVEYEDGDIFDLFDYNHDALKDFDVFEELELQPPKKHVKYEDGDIFVLFDYNHDALKDLDVFEELELQPPKKLVEYGDGDILDLDNFEQKIEQQKEQEVEEDVDKEKQHKEKYSQEDQQQHDIRLNNDDNDDIKKSICCSCILL